MAWLFGLLSIVEVNNPKFKIQNRHTLRPLCAGDPRKVSRTAIELDDDHRHVVVALGGSDEVMHVFGDGVEEFG